VVSEKYNTNAEVFEYQKIKRKIWKKPTRVNKHRG